MGCVAATVIKYARKQAQDFTERTAKPAKNAKIFIFLGGLSALRGEMIAATQGA